jgi:hypothetical protein
VTPLYVSIVAIAVLLMVAIVALSIVLHALHRIVTHRPQPIVLPPPPLPFNHVPPTDWNLVNQVQRVADVLNTIEWYAREERQQRMGNP